MLIELSLSAGAGVFYDANYVKSEDVEFEKRLHPLLNFGYSESNVGYRRVFEVDLVPFNDDKLKLFNLFSWMVSNEKWLAWYTNASGHVVNPTFTSGVLDAGFTRNVCRVVYQDNVVPFSHGDGSYFMNGVTLRCYESGLNTIVDTGSTLTLKPVYGNSGLGISGNTYTCRVNLVDQSSVEVGKKAMRYISGNYGSRDFGYLHTLQIDFDAIKTVTEREWLRTFCLWGLKNIDTTAIDSYNGKVFSVVFAGSELFWNYVNGISEAKSTVLMFKERALRRTVETYVAPDTDAHEFQLDTDVLDGTDVVLG